MEFPFSITLHGRKARANFPVRTLTAALAVVQEEVIAYFNDIDLSEAALQDFIKSDEYEVIVDKRRRIWAEGARAPFRIQMFLKYRFENAADIQRIRANMVEFFGGLDGLIQYDANMLPRRIAVLDDNAIFSQNYRHYRVEAELPDPWRNTYKGNIQARTAERTMAKLYALPQNVIREIGSYVGTRRRESAPRLRPLPPALRNSAIREAGNLPKPEKAPAEVRPASPVRSETRKKNGSFLKRMFTRRKN